MDSAPTDWQFLLNRERGSHSFWNLPGDIRHGRSLRNSATREPLIAATERPALHRRRGGEPDHGEIQREKA